MTKTVHVVFEGDTLRPSQSLNLIKGQEYEIIIINDSDFDDGTSDPENILLKLSNLAVNTGIPNLAVNHDFYLQGAEKQVNNE